MKPVPGRGQRHGVAAKRTGDVTAEWFPEGSEGEGSRGDLSDQPDGHRRLEQAVQIVVSDVETDGEMIEGERPARQSVRNAEASDGADDLARSVTGHELVKTRRHLQVRTGRRRLGRHLRTVTVQLVFVPVRYKSA